MDYTITRVAFSYRQEDEQVSPVLNKRMTYLVCHISFRYKGLSNSDEYGTVVKDLQKLTEVSIDSEGHVSSLVTTPLQYPDWETLEPVVNSVVESEIDSVNCRALERSYYKESIGKMEVIKVPEESTIPGSYVEAELNGWSHPDNILTV